MWATSPKSPRRTWCKGFSHLSMCLPRQTCTVTVKWPLRSPDLASVGPRWPLASQRGFRAAELEAPLATPFTEQADSDGSVYDLKSLSLKWAHSFGCLIAQACCALRKMGGRTFQLDNYSTPSRHMFRIV